MFSAGSVDAWRAQSRTPARFNETRAAEKPSISTAAVSVCRPVRSVGVRNPALASDPRTLRRWAREDHKRYGTPLPPKKKPGRKLIDNPSKSALFQRRYRERIRLGLPPLPRGAKPRPDPSPKLIRARLYRAIKKAEQALKEKERRDGRTMFGDVDCALLRRLDTNMFVDFMHASLSIRSRASRYF